MGGITGTDTCMTLSLTLSLRCGCRRYVKRRKPWTPLHPNPNPNPNPKSTLTLTLTLTLPPSPQTVERPPPPPPKQLNSWCIYNWERGTQMSQKAFIIQVACGGLAALDAERCAFLGPSPQDRTQSPDLLSPTAKVTPRPARFSCRREELASIAASRHYK